MLHFHPELPLAHNHPPLGPSAKITEAPEYPFTRAMAVGDPGRYNPLARLYHEQHPGISRHDLS